MSPCAAPAVAAARGVNPAKPLRRAASYSTHARFPHLFMSSSPRTPPLAAAAGGSGAAAPSSLLAADPGHRDAVLLAARSAMGNCLGETRLDLAVSGLRLAAKGKVSKPLARHRSEYSSKWL